MSMISKILTALLVVGALVALASPAVAGESVSIEVRAILASPEGDEFDEELNDIQGRLERGFTGYHSFEQIGRQTKTIERAADADFDLPTGDVLTLGYDGRDDDLIKLGLTLETRLSTTLRATPGSTFFQAGLRHEDGLLILAITVE